MSTDTKESQQLATEGEGRKRRKTSHLKDVPQSLELRESLRDRCNDVASRLDRRVPLTKDEMEQVARQTLREADLPERYLGWVMVMLSSGFWRDSLAAVPPHRRLFLLPHCLKHAQGCPAEYDQFGMNCKECGACSIADFRGLAEDLGYRVLVAEGSPVVMKIIVGGYVDAVVGVACLNVLEKAIDKVLLAGIPCMAVPLLSSDCRNTKVDEPWVEQMIRTPYQPAGQVTRSYVHLMRAANDLFQPESLDALSPRIRSSDPLGQTAISKEQIQSTDPIAATELIAYDFLARGGKRSRPFITLAAYDAIKSQMDATKDVMTTEDSSQTDQSGPDNAGPDAAGSDVADWGATGPHADQAIAAIPASVRRAAISIETFHKASLVHDDIQDDDAYRYGQLAVHRRFGLPTAINVGDYLIGLGYRLLSKHDADDPTDAAARADVVDALAAAHLRLSEGQGAELLWRDASDRRLKPLDALKIYALKTAPAFEAALTCGIRLAGDVTPLTDAIRGFSRNLGVAFQIINDLNDWIGDSDNKLQSGNDALQGRPTLLWALAIETLDTADQQTLLDLTDPNCPLDQADRLASAKRLYQKANVFQTALKLVDKHQERAEAIADDLDCDGLRRLFYFLVDSVLERPELPSPSVVSLGTTTPMETSPSQTR